MNLPEFTNLNPPPEPKTENILLQLVTKIFFYLEYYIEFSDVGSYV